MATTFLLNSAATFLQTALHDSNLWAGSLLAGPEAVLTLPSSALFISEAALFISEGETQQLILVVCFMLLVLLQANMTAWDQAWELICSQQCVCALQ